jgi:hypothetical protein
MRCIDPAHRNVAQFRMRYGLVESELLGMLSGARALLDIAGDQRIDVDVRVDRPALISVPGAGAGNGAFLVSEEHAEPVTLDDGQVFHDPGRGGE